MSHTKKKLSGDELYAFQTIQDFINNLHDYFGKQCHSVSLYHRLVEKLSFSDHDLITRHLKTFKQFCVSNRDAILNKDSTRLSPIRIDFSAKIYIDVPWILGNADEETTGVIWEYLITISALLDPSSRAKELLQTLQSGSKEEQFLSTMIESVGEQVGSMPTQNPMEMLGGLMNSNMIGTMMSSMNNQNLDMGKLMQSMQGLMKNVQSEIEKSDDPLIQNLVQMVSQMPTPPSKHNETTD